MPPPTKLSIPAISMNPLAWLAAAFASGIAVQHITGLPAAVLALACAFVFALGLLTRRWTVMLVVFVSAGMLSLELERSGVGENRLKRMLEDGRLVSGDPMEVEGVVAGPPEPAPKGAFITLAADKVLARQAELDVSGRLRIFALGNEYSRLGHGTRIRVACRPEREDRFRNPGVIPRTRILDQQGIDATCSVKSPLLIEKLGSDSVFLPTAVAYELRGRMITTIGETFNPSTAGVLIASMLGDKYFLDRETADIFRSGGTFHVLVISGLHITFIGFFILFVVRQFTKRRPLQATIVISLLWLYGIAVGADAPVTRACVMFTTFMVGYASFRQSTLLNTLGASVLLLLVWEPGDLFDPSFQLTVVSVAAIVLFAIPVISLLRAIGKWTPSAAEPFPPNVPNGLRRFCEMLYWHDDLWRIESKRQVWSANIQKRPYLSWLATSGIRRTVVFVFESFVVSASVSICLLPLTVYYFHRVTPMSVLLNAWVGAALAIESFAALVSIALLQVNEVLALPLITLTEVANWLLVNMQSAMVGVFADNWRVPVYSGPMRAVYLLYFVPVVAAATAISRWEPFSLTRQKTLSHAAVLSFAFVVTLAGIIIFHPFSGPSADGKLRVDILDVGQGDAAFLTFPNGETMLVDGGGRVRYGEGEEDSEPDIPRIGETVVSEFLWERGYSAIGSIAATHADADHIQGLVDVARNFRVGTAYFGEIRGVDPNERTLIDVLQVQRIHTKQLRAGEVLEIAGVRVEVLNPFNGSSGSANDGSLVLRLVFGEVEFLLTGDIERGAEGHLTSAGAALNADVVKVPHHGSRTSSTEAFIGAVGARFAIVSVPRRSRFGHPHPGVVERWRAAGAEILTTGEYGMITFSTDGNHMEISSYSGWVD